MRRPVLFAALLAAAITVRAEDASSFIKARQSDIMLELSKSNGADESKVMAGMDALLDYESMAAASLGAEWTARTDAERAQFSAVFRQLVRQSYRRNLLKIMRHEITYLAAAPVAPPAGNMLLVQTRVKTGVSAEETLEIHFRMMPAGADWKVHDIVTEGVSLVSSYRSQFTKIVRKDGFPVLIEKMQAKIAQD